jgi:hypothetical protein
LIIPHEKEKRGRDDFKDAIVEALLLLLLLLETICISECKTHDGILKMAPKGHRVIGFGLCLSRACMQRQKTWLQVHSASVADKTS